MDTGSAGKTYQALRPLCCNPPSSIPCVPHRVAGFRSQANVSSHRAPRTLALDLRTVNQELRGVGSVAGRNVLGPLEDIYLLREHGYRRIDDVTVLHVMDYEVLQPYRMQVDRSDTVCIQVTTNGAYQRITADGTRQVDAATTHVTNHPRSITSAEPGQHLRGIWIACDRQHFVDRFALHAANVPPDYRPIFHSCLGLPQALEMPTLTANVIAVEQIMACRLAEPLNSLYVSAKTTEIMCNVVAQIQALHARTLLRSAPPSTHKHQAIQVAAEIYQNALARPPSIDKLARWVGLNRNELTAGFRDQFGTTPHAYGLALRMQQARLMLSIGDLSISDIARKVGYGSYSSFARAHRAYYGKAPSAWHSSGTTTRMQD